VVNDPDEDLVERCRDGDRAAFAALVRRYQKPLYNAAYRILGRDEDARDITQLVFLRVVERLDQYDPRFKFFSWIYRIAVNESLNVLRKEREAELPQDEEQAGPESSDPAWQANEAQVSRRIQAALMAMRAPDRVVLSLRHFHDCSYDEMAEILEIEVKTVKSRLFEARQRLKEMLADLRTVT
jgi:RNA polymerase sigma-70 factor, ECF subfamily